MDPESLQALLKQLQGLDEPQDRPGANAQADSDVRDSDLETSNTGNTAHHGGDGDSLKDSIIQDHSDAALQRRPDDPVVSSGPVENQGCGQAVKSEELQLSTNADPGHSDLQKLLQTLQPVGKVGDPTSDTPLNIVEQSDYAAWYEDDSRYYRPVEGNGVRATSVKAPADNHESKSASGSSHLRSLTYAQALPILSKLAAELAFVESFQELRREQEAVELQLLDERNRVKGDLERQINQARTMRSQPSPLEIERLTKAMTVRLAEWDKDALKRWDIMVRSQQSHLEALGVPCFYPLLKADAIAMERQRRVMETLVSLVQDV